MTARQLTGPEGDALAQAVHDSYLIGLTREGPCAVHRDRPTVGLVVGRDYAWRACEQCCTESERRGFDVHRAPEVKPS